MTHDECDILQSIPTCISLCSRSQYALEIQSSPIDWPLSLNDRVPTFFFFASQLGPNSVSRGSKGGEAPIQLFKNPLVRS